jgi:hypothetical protein
MKLERCAGHRWILESLGKSELGVPRPKRAKDAEFLSVETSGQFLFSTAQGTKAN